VTTTAATATRRDTRIVAGAMLGAGVVWSRFPVHPPLACPLRTLTGIPCPLCGMTRAVVAALHGHLLESLRFNPAGILVVLVAVTLVAGLRVDRWRISPWILLAFTAVLWAWNIGLNPTFR
jgi:hypothetical protein